jgi:leucyl/phenylalanyl-tRNA---protein transferase
MLTWIDDDEALPPTQLAWGADSDAPGLLAAGGSLEPWRLEEAYRRGVFPWFGPDQPVLWWSPDPRMVLPVASFRLSKSLAKTIRRFVRGGGNAVRIDSDRRRVIEACAGTPRDGQDGTWIVPEMVRAYSAWTHRVHSVETWIGGELAGGLYGVAIGRMFFGESMFAWQTDASKIALAALVCFCREHAITLIDCQQNTGHLASMGAHEIGRAEFEAHLSHTSGEPDIAEWSYDLRMWSRLEGLAAATSPERE